MDAENAELDKLDERDEAENRIGPILPTSMWRGYGGGGRTNRTDDAGVGASARHSTSWSFESQVRVGAGVVITSHRQSQRR